MSWKRFSTEAPELAERVWAPFAAERHAVMGTIRRDGSPRLSGVEAKLIDGEIWLGFMSGSLKGKDLLREPRFALHNSTTMDDFKKAGDSRISGTAELVTDDAAISRYAEWMRTNIAFDPTIGGFDLFRAEVTETLVITTDGSQLIFDSWTPATGIRQHHRA